METCVIISRAMRDFHAFSSIHFANTNNSGLVQLMLPNLEHEPELFL